MNVVGYRFRRRGSCGVARGGGVVFVFRRSLLNRDCAWFVMVEVAVGYDQPRCSSRLFRFWILLLRRVPSRHVSLGRSCGRCDFGPGGAKTRGRYHGRFRESAGRGFDELVASELRSICWLHGFRRG